MISSSTRKPQHAPEVSSAIAFEDDLGAVDQIAGNK